MTTNDREYWDGRFREDWQAHGGPAQTRFFTQLALEAMPTWFVERVRGAGLSLCDWGCAEGEGAAMLARELGAPVVGIDFSETAIVTARSKFPDVEFRAVDWLAEDADAQFDVVFSSNTLEHFHAPWEVFDSIARHASRYVILLVPYREEDRHPEHFAGFDPTSVPAARGGWALAHAAVIDARDYDDTQWEGEQILAIYARPVELEAAGVTLEQLRVDTPVLESLRDQQLTSEGLQPGAGGSTRALPKAVRGLQAQMGEMQSQLVAAISNDIARMQGEHARMLEAAGALQAELGVARNELAATKRELATAQAQLTEQGARQANERAGRAEALAEWSVQVWGSATEQRAAMEALIEAVGSMEGRVVGAITNDIARMQHEHARVMESAAALQAELGKAEGRIAEIMLRAESVEGQLRTELDMAQAREVELQSQAAATEAALAGELYQTRAQLEGAHAQLDASQAQLAAMRHEAVDLRAQSATLQQVLGSTSWRITRPLRVARRFLRQGLTPDDKARLGASFRRAALALPLPASLRTRLLTRQGSGHAPPLDSLPTQAELEGCRDALAERVDGIADVFVWSVIDWHFRTQRPQHLAQALATKGHRVFYMSNNLVDAGLAGYSLEPLDEGGRLFQVHLNVAGAPSIYAGQASPEQASQLMASLAKLLSWTHTCKSVSLVQHPFWVAPAQSVPNAQLVYDCMDHHAGFENNAAAVIEAEAELVEQSDLVIASSAWLADEMSARNEKVALVRNAAEYAHFSQAPDEVFRDPDGRRVIGYYGAIAEWFDVALVRKVAQDHPQHLLLLVGCDTAGAGAQLEDLANVKFTGEVAYRELPYWLHGMDVCLLPFLVTPLTVATNPVKVYEYLAAGKPVVAVDVPEMAQFQGLVDVAVDAGEFSAAVGRRLAATGSEQVRNERQAFAAGQTWEHRAAAIDRAIATVPEPKVSVVVLTYNNLPFTDACLFSLDAYSDYPNLEIIVVDNASSDGSREYLAAWAASGRNRKLIQNDDNRGFAAGNNQGLEAATGDVLVLLNNDTYVTPGWVRTMLWHLRRDPAAGLVGPVTNNIGNEARIDIAYEDMSDMIRQSSRYTLAHPGSAMALPMVAFFCVMLRRNVYERVGGLDEAFGIGFFEDDDYCRRVAEAGWKVVCAEDVFVHHHLSASFGALDNDVRQALFDRNKVLYESKWGCWSPHAYR